MENISKKFKVFVYLLVVACLFSQLHVAEITALRNNSDKDRLNNNRSLVNTESKSTQDSQEIGENSESNEKEDNVIDPADIYRNELLQHIPNSKKYISYMDYLEQFSEVKKADRTIELDLSMAEKIDMKDIDNQEIEAELITDSSGSVKIQFDVAEEALYQFEVTYMPLGGSSNIKRVIKIDDEVPYDEATQIELSRTYENANDDYKAVEGNQAFPAQVEKQIWKTKRLTDRNGYFSDPLYFYLSKGSHTIEIQSVRGEMAIQKLAFVEDGKEKVPTYAEYEAEHKNNGAKLIENSEISHIQAEDAKYKSSPSLYPLSDNTSAITEPQHYTYIRMNTIGGESWSKPGEKIEWEIDVPKSGLYRLALRARQAYNTGSISIRKLMVNGEVPFKEAEKLEFPYNNTWKIYELADSDGNSQYIYLDEGVNVFSLEVSLGEFAELIYFIEDISTNLNGIAQDIMVVTGAQPDPFRDYQLIQNIPDLLPRLQEENAKLKDVLERLINVMGGRNDKTAVAEQVTLQIDEMLDKPAKIASKLSVLQNGVTSLGTLALNLKSQSLTLDYLTLLGSKDSLPKNDAGFFKNMSYRIMGFFGSFWNDYDKAGTSNEEQQVEAENEITVWISTGRDQMEVTRRLISDTFDSKYKVNLRVVSPAVALSATAVGQGPDVIVQTASEMPIDYALRNAAYDLSQFADYEEVAAQLHPAALESFKFNDEVYALSDQMSYPVMFYRKDILSDLNIPVPQTWDDILSIVPFLQNNNMEFFMQVNMPLTLGSAYQATSKPIPAAYLSMLYQKGVPLYNEEGTLAMTATDEALDVFEYWTNFYTRHSFPVTADFVTRFRLGIIPIAIVNFTNYNTLSVSAPEIEGDWSVAPVPGTLKENGEIDRSMPVANSAAMIIKNSVEKRGNSQAAWEFLKWWVSENTQTSYAREMEAILGSSARYPVANLESFSKMPWPDDVMDVLTESLEYIKGVRQVPGSYITGRNIENAFYEVVNNPESANSDRIMREWTENTNYELNKKRREFGLPTHEDIMPAKNVERRQNDEEGTADE